MTRAAALCVLTPFLTFASGLAPQHIHEPGPGHDHGHAVAHSHFTPHDPDHRHSNDLEIESNDADHGHVVWADSPILHEATYRTVSVPAALPAGYDGVPAEIAWAITPYDDAAPAHGPPKRAHLLRGPPLPRLS